MCGRLNAGCRSTTMLSRRLEMMPERMCKTCFPELRVPKRRKIAEEPRPAEEVVDFGKAQASLDEECFEEEMGNLVEAKVAASLEAASEAPSSPVRNPFAGSSVASNSA